MDDTTTQHGAAAAAAKAAPPVTVAGLDLAGVPLNELVLIATLVYTLLQIHFLLKEKKVYSRIMGVLKSVRKSGK